MAESRKRTSYDSMEKTNHSDKASLAPQDDENLSSVESENVSQATPAYRVVVVGRTGCGKSTICNALLNADMSPVPNMAPCTCDFKSEINKENNLEVVDTPDVFNMGYRTEEEARNKFREVKALTPSEIPTALLFPIRLDERFTPNHYHLCHKYLQMLADPYKNTILVLIKAQRHDSEMTDDSMNQTFLPKLLDMFDDRVIRLQNPLEMEERKGLIKGVMGHLHTMKPLSLQSSGSVWRRFRDSRLIIQVVNDCRRRWWYVGLGILAAVLVVVLTVWRLPFWLRRRGP